MINALNCDLLPLEYRSPLLELLKLSELFGNCVASDTLAKCSDNATELALITFKNS